MMKVMCAVVNDGSVFAVDIDARLTVSDLMATIVKCMKLTCPAHSLKLYQTKHADDHGNGAWLDSSHEDVAKLETGEIAKTIAALMVNKMDSAFGIDDYCDERTPKKRVIHVLVVVPQAEPDENAVRAAAIAQEDNGSTTNWLNQFRATDMNWSSLPKVADLPDYVQSALAVPIGIREYQLNSMSARLNPKDPALLARLFERTGSSPCVDLYNNVLKRIVDPVKTGTTENAFISFWDDMIRHVLDAVFCESCECDRGTSRPGST